MSQCAFLKHVSCKLQTILIAKGSLRILCRKLV